MKITRKEMRQLIQAVIKESGDPTLGTDVRPSTRKSRSMAGDISPSVSSDVRRENLIPDVEARLNKYFDGHKIVSRDYDSLGDDSPGSGPYPRGSIAQYTEYVILTDGTSGMNERMAKDIEKTLNTPKFMSVFDKYYEANIVPASDLEVDTRIGKYTISAQDTLVNRLKKSLSMDTGKEVWAAFLSFRYE